jgi:hypothetical protein
MNEAIKVIGSVEPRSYSNIDTTANNLIKELCPYIQLGDPVPIVDLVEFDLRKRLNYALDVRPVADFNDSSVEAAAIFKEDGKFFIIPEKLLENANNGNSRDRFTLAHEAGHFVLEHNIGLPVYGSLRENRNSIEAFRNPDWQADCFAGAFLMPGFLLMKLRQKLQKRLDITDVVKYFRVSESAANIRLKKFRTYVNSSI